MDNQQIVESHEFHKDYNKSWRNKTMFSRAGILYSYDIHYPLMWQTNGIIFANITYYSQTTARHSALASRRADCTIKLPHIAIGQGVDRCYFGAKAMFDFYMDEVVEIQSTISKIKRKGTQKEQLLRYRLNDISHAINLLKKGG